MDCYLQILGFQPTLGDLYIYVRKQECFIDLISIYVDDCLLIVNFNCIFLIKEAIVNAFKSKDLEEVMSILGIEVICNCNQGILKLCQKGLINSILSLCNMKDCKPQDTPLTIGFILEKIDNTPLDCFNLLYCQAIGKLLYLALGTRPDIAYVVSYLSCFVTAYNYSHWQTLKHIICYLKGIIDLTICYDRNTVPPHLPASVPLAYCNAD